ncbi:helix-turn-helix domain-containing protein [Pseudomonas fragi]|uniref:helix-turn-helix domain-containing protein n=1 Tax=Pseudomonas fragi TaxID=296 RepID=UPI001474A2E2|nr:helix-turn-helix domain-containing protein [Pseudomonas fragi]NNB34177.1 MarR family transcriptional regulator [Pseudomonas fragi]
MPTTNSLDDLFAVFPCDSRCPSDFSAGFDAVLSRLSVSSSLTSRRFPVWSLVRAHLNIAFDRAIADYEGIWAIDLLAGAQLSEMAKTPPAICPELMVLVRPDGQADLHADLVATDCTAGKPVNMPEIEWQLLNLERWDANLRFAIRSLHMEGGKCSPSGEALCGVLESVRDLFRLLKSFRPRVTKAVRDFDTLVDDRTRPQHAVYCELCWRESIRSKRLQFIDDQERREVDALLSLAERPLVDLLAMRALAVSLKITKWQSSMEGLISRSRACELGLIFERFRIERMNAGNLSQRYCSIHKPGSAKYHADLRYKAAFSHHLSVLQGRGKSEFALNLPVPNSADMQEFRKTAYDQVHSGLHAVAPKGSPSMGLREKVLLMRQEGLSQSEMARRLGVSRQAISKAKKSLETLVDVHQAGSYLNPLTGEAQVPEHIRARIRDGMDRGLSVAMIAREVRLSKGTVDGLIRLMDDRDSACSS